MSEWGPKHSLESDARSMEIAAELRRAGNVSASYGLACAPSATESDFRRSIGAAGLGPARIDREVRRVRGLAEGRLVRETGWRGTSRDGSTLAWTQDPATARRWRETGARVVRVTRIRKVRP
ncbi:MAG TPA: hypothetical protein VLT61_17550 [Anaeromyxobacteraceae bacterium]|nr:hypothetical protein [Anaeromyxobacteraceae bacterium]